MGIWGCDADFELMLLTTAKRKLLFFISLLLGCCHSAAATDILAFNNWAKNHNALICLEEISEYQELAIIEPSKDTTLSPRLTAIAINVALGLFGMHRVYLGTDIAVPIFYTFTLGGGGVLWLFDLGCLIFKRDIKSFYDNPNVFMIFRKNSRKTR